MPKITSSWKNLERYVARVLGGKRVCRGSDFGESAPDVLHDYFSIECKYRTGSFKTLYDYMKQAEKYSEGKIPLTVIRQKGKKALAVLDLEDFGHIFKNAKVSLDDPSSD